MGNESCGQSGTVPLTHIFFLMLFPCSGVGPLHDLQCCMEVSTEKSLLWHLQHLLLRPGCLQGTLSFSSHTFPEVAPSCLWSSAVPWEGSTGGRGMFEGDLCQLCAWPGSEIFVPQKSQLATKSVPRWLLLVSRCPCCCTPGYANNQWGLLRAERRERRVVFSPGVKKMPAREKLLNRRSISGEGREEACAAVGRLGLRHFGFPEAVGCGKHCG